MMRQIVISGLIALGTIVSCCSVASASERYPTKKRYVNQTGQVMAVGEPSHVMAIAEAPQRRSRALPAVQVVPVAEAPIFANPAPRLVVAQTQRPGPRNGLFGPINIDPADWPSGRKCCRPGEAYFNEEPNS
jgi:hypothetical protein